MTIMSISRPCSVVTRIMLKLIADGPIFLVQETRTRNFAPEICIQVAHKTIQVSRTRNMADDRDDEEFQILFFLG